MTGAIRVFDGVVQSSFLRVVDTAGGDDASASGSRIRVGTASWTDPTLLRSGWYPAGVTDAAGRLRHYASKFSVVEADAPYYAIPAPAVAEAWVDRTSASFAFNVKAHALLTGHRTDPARLPGAVRRLLGEVACRQATVDRADVGPEAMLAVREAFGAFIKPLQASGRLGTLLFQYPRWFVPGDRADATLDAIRDEFADTPIAVEFRNALWAEPIAFREATARLRALQMVFVGVDAPRGIVSAMPPVDAVTNPQVAILRLHGRNVEAWDARHTTAANRFNYRYGDDELEREVAPRARRLADEAAQVHVIFNNCHEDDGVRNAARLSELVATLPAC